MAASWRLLLLALFVLGLFIPVDARRHRYGNGRYGSHGSPDEAARSAISRPQRVADPLALAREEAAPLPAMEDEEVDTRPEESLEALEDEVISAVSSRNGRRIQLDGARRAFAPGLAVRRCSPCCSWSVSRSYVPAPRADSKIAFGAVAAVTIMSAFY